MSEKKSRILYIKRLLDEQTDEDHPITITDILTFLESEGIQASRQTVAREIEQLIESGVDVVCNKGKPTQYFIGNRYFELPELKLLIDAVQASRIIPPIKATALIETLSGFASYHQAEELKRSLYTDKQIRPVDSKVYITVDLLYTAVNAQKKIIYKYFDWNADKKRIYKHGQSNSFSPYGLVWNNDRYYTVGWSDSHGKIIVLRVDRIATPKLTDEFAVKKPEDFDIAHYAQSAVQMYNSPVRKITLICENEMMKHVIDRFGEDVHTEITDENHFTAFVEVPASPTFFAWVFTFSGGIRVTATEDVAAAYQEMVAAAIY